MSLDYIALGVMIFVIVFMFYGIIAIHDIPYEIAKHRNHPHLDAIHVAGWVSLFTLHAIWPFLWIWATLYREEQGWGMNRTQRTTDDLTEQVTQLRVDLKMLTNQVERQGWGFQDQAEALAVQRQLHQLNAQVQALSDRQPTASDDHQGG